MTLGVRQLSKQDAALTVGGTLAVSAGLWYVVWRAVARQKRVQLEAGGPPARECARTLRIRLLYGSTTGMSEQWATHIASKISNISGGGSARLDICVEDLATFLFDSLLAAPHPAACAPGEAPAPSEVIVVLLSTHTGGAAPPHCEHFCQLLEDHVHDFRVGRVALAHLGFAVLGFGSVVYESTGHFCTAAARVDGWLARLAAHRLVPFARITDTEDAAAQVAPWSEKLTGAIAQLARGTVPPAVSDARAQATGSVAQQPDGGSETDDSEDSDKVSEKVAGDAGSDVEELAESCAGLAVQPQEREMLTKRHRAQLTKEGYRLIGSHSAVKLCRWTKHQLRGRGGCYKHSFYGITSYQCMEATPSLACANKCVFCWRHHKNPVGTSWKWRTDEPDFIVTQSIEKHRIMIRECRGIPGVRKDRFAEAMTVRHCALSLVGEPIMYPRINELLAELHRRRISTFLVTNAQFPEAIRSLMPVTQLYVSVDAATREDLKAVDRPLFADFWERYVASLRALREKKQRTVYRLTLVRGHNMTSVKDYAKLVALGEPDFLEIKSVTFCGESKASSLQMTNVPWHEEVKAFTEALLAEEGLSTDYQLACEHQHSCIVLIAHRRYNISGRCHTWIDYDRFHELIAEGRDFDAMEYAAPTPDWALYGCEEAGFDPADTRVFHNRTKRRAQAGTLSEQQLQRYTGNVGG